MGDQQDPLAQFFPEELASTPDILYKTLKLSSTSTSQEIKSSYRKLALKFHPDKHSTASSTTKDEMSKEFQRVGYAYAVLSDEGRRKR
jgi:DnaJ family protein C protein 9